MAADLRLAAAVLLCACAPPTPVTIHFRGTVGADDFSCGRSFTVNGASWVPRDFRLYVSEVQVLDAKGVATPVSLVDDGRWQGRGVALLDFEDASGECGNGTPATNDHVVGSLPVGVEPTTLRFTLGVPFALDHADATTAAPPLDSSAMFWSWQAGYKFLRLEGKTAGLSQGLNLHLGSMGCQPGSGANAVRSCDFENTVTVTVPSFSLEHDTVAVDLAALLATSDLQTNTVDTPVLCMSTPDDPDCAPIFAALGLPFGNAAAGTQTFFRKR
jgi:uncharacterized repeat protein (TIGR04052 family)